MLRNADIFRIVPEKKEIYRGIFLIETFLTELFLSVGLLLEFVSLSFDFGGEELENNDFVTNSKRVRKSISNSSTCWQFDYQ